MKTKFIMLFCILSVFLKAQTLPVELVYFEASVQANSVLLLFGTATEQNNYGFDVERSDSLRIWETIGFVSKPPFNSNVPKDYDFEDTSITTNGTYYYRLKQLDLSGGFEYSWEDTVYIDFITSVYASDEFMPHGFVLYQNYPNPFNPVTNFEFRISDFGLVTLKIYNLLGEHLITLLNEEKYPGEYKISFNATNLPSGIYYYKLTANGYSETKQMLLIK